MLDGLDGLPEYGRASVINKTDTKKINQKLRQAKL